MCAHDELENLRELIPLLLRQDYPAGFELILVDDRSQDDTYLLRPAAEPVLPRPLPAGDAWRARRPASPPKNTPSPWASRPPATPTCSSPMPTAAPPAPTGCA
ncbi:MAG: glycosyltransferase [Hymenobacter sp.]